LIQSGVDEGATLLLDGRGLKPKGFENGNHLSLIQVSRLVGHANISTTLKYTNFETSQAFGLYELS
jgi:hypothetical protein